MTLVRWRPRRRWNPLAELDLLHDQLNRAFGSSLADWAPSFGWGTSFPSVDVYQDKDNVIVTAEVPGLGREDVDLTITGNTLTVKGEKKHASEEKEDNYQHVERASGSFQRVIELPVEAEAAKATATLEHGVLTLTLPKSAAVKPKQIAIDVK